MRIINIILSAAAIMMFYGCGGADRQAAVDTADKFISSYFAADYATAKTLCSPEFRLKIEESEEIINALPDSLRQAFDELSAQVETRRTEVYGYSQDSLLVEFDIIVPGEMETLRNAVCVVRNEGTGMWEVTEMR